MGRFSLLKDLSSADIEQPVSNKPDIVVDKSTDDHRIYTIEFENKTLKVGVPVINELQFDTAIAVDNPKIDEILQKFNVVIMEGAL